MSSHAFMIQVYSPLVALLVQVLEPAAFLGKPLYIRYYWSFKFVNKSSMKKQYSENSKKQHWVILIHDPTNDFKGYNTFTFWVILTAPKKGLPRSSPFPWWLVARRLRFAENASTSRGLCYMPCFEHLFTTTRCPFGTLWTETHLKGTTIELACDRCFRSEFRRWHSLWSSQIWEFAIVDCDFKHCSKVKEALDRFGMILFYCCDTGML